MMVLAQVSGQALTASPEVTVGARALEPGQVIEARVVGPAEDGLTRLAIGKGLVDVALPQRLAPGTSLLIQVEGTGADQRLLVLQQTPIAVAEGRPTAISVPGGATSALALKPGQVVEAKVVSTTEGGLTRVAIGKEILDLRLPTRPEPGTSLRIQVQGTGENQRVVILPQTAELAPQARQASIPAPAGRAGAPVLTSGQVIEAKVVGPAESGLTRLAVGKGHVDVALPRPLEPGTSLRVQVQGTGESQRFVVLSETSSPSAQVRPTVVAVPRAIATALALEPGQVIDAKVVSTTEGGLTRLAIGKEFVDVSLSRTFEPGTNLRLQAQGSGENQRFLILPQTPGAPAGARERLVLAIQNLPAGPVRDAMAQMALTAAGRQDSVGALFANLALLKRDGHQMPKSVEHAANKALAARLDLPAQAPSGAVLKQAVLRSGIFLEALLGKGGQGLPAAGVQGDLKATLLALRGALTSWLGGDLPANARREQSRPRPPTQGDLPRAQRPEAPTLPSTASPKEAGRLLLAQTEAALARITLAQLASLPDLPARAGSGQQAGPAEWNFEIPLSLNGAAGMAQFQISRDGGSGSQEGERGWQMRFSVDLDTVGGVHAQVTLRDGRVGVMLWAERDDTARELCQMLPELGEALEAVGLSVGNLHCRPGAPREPERHAGVFMDRST